jgi:hypothetical protein
MITAMIVLFLCEILLFVHHFIVAPDFRVSLELQLYELRNEIILLKAECVSPAAARDCLILQESIEFMIRKLPRLSVASLVFIELESRRDPGFLATAQERARMLDESTVPRVRTLRQRALNIATKAFAVNGVPWSMLLIAPSVLAAVRSRLSALTSLSVREFQQATPWDRGRWSGKVKSA